MINSLLLIIHISGGIIGILSGMGALIPRKGSHRHILIGNIFFISMVCMTLSATYLAIFSEPSKMNATMGLLVFYMIVTAKRTAKNKTGKAGVVEKVGLVYILAIFVAFVTFIVEISASGKESLGDGIPAGAYYFFTTIVAIALISDVKLIYQRGIYGAQRIARHLWRMCFALFVATGSLFLGQPQVFPEPVRKIEFLAIPVLIVIVALFFWLFRVFVIRRFKLHS